MFLRFILKVVSQFVTKKRSRRGNWPRLLDRNTIRYGINSLYDHYLILYIGLSLERLDTQLTFKII